jgi:hypothetical protein
MYIFLYIQKESDTLILVETPTPNQSNKRTSQSVYVGWRRSDLGRVVDDWFYFFLSFCLVLFFRSSYTVMLTSHNYTQRFVFTIITTI